VQTAFRINAMTKGQGLRDRTAAAIIDSAATVLAVRGEAVSMEEIANSAGIGRATLYRYFSNREELLRAMAAASVRELTARVKEADLDVVSFDEAIPRLARGILATGSKYVALSLDSAELTDAYPEMKTEVIEPIRALFRRAIADGSLRQDLPPDVLLDLFSGLIKGGLSATVSGRRGIEETAAAVATLFLHGSRGEQEHSQLP
jgi:TetR/AcrR family transcriptional regulator, mexCD-oprJ operon repressor